MNIDLGKLERDAVIKIAREICADVEAAYAVKDHEPEHVFERHSKMARLLGRLLEALATFLLMIVVVAVIERRECNCPYHQHPERY